jgi:hypothetical protein
VGPAGPGEAVPAAPLPDPALIVLVGPSGSGKSFWAAERYRPAEVVSSDRLRAVVGSGEHHLDARASYGGCGPRRPIPEPWVTLGMLAGLEPGLRHQGIPERAGLAWHWPKR